MAQGRSVPEPSASFCGGCGMGSGLCERSISRPGNHEPGLLASNAVRAIPMCTSSSLSARSEGRTPMQCENTALIPDLPPPVCSPVCPPLPATFPRHGAGRELDAGGRRLVSHPHSTVAIRVHTSRVGEPAVRTLAPGRIPSLCLPPRVRPAAIKPRSLALLLPPYPSTPNSPAGATVTAILAECMTETPSLGTGQ